MTSQAQASTRRDELLAIAAELFATKGFKNTTVRDIADAAGILSGSLYHPKPYIWTASVATIIEKVDRARRTLDRLTTNNANSDALH